MGSPAGVAPGRARDEEGALALGEDDDELAAAANAVAPYAALALARQPQLAGHGAAAIAELDPPDRALLHLGPAGHAAPLRPALGRRVGDPRRPDLLVGRVLLVGLLEVGGLGVVPEWDRHLVVSREPLVV